MGKNSLKGTNTCYIRNNRADSRFYPKYARHGKDNADSAADRRYERMLARAEKETCKERN